MSRGVVCWTARHKRFILKISSSGKYSEASWNGWNGRNGFIFTVSFYLDLNSAFGVFWKIVSVFSAFPWMSQKCYYICKLIYHPVHNVKLRLSNNLLIDVTLKTNKFPLPISRILGLGHTKPSNFLCLSSLLASLLVLLSPLVQMVISQARGGL